MKESTQKKKPVTAKKPVAKKTSNKKPTVKKSSTTKSVTKKNPASGSKAVKTKKSELKPEIKIEEEKINETIIDQPLVKNENNAMGAIIIAILTVVLVFSVIANHVINRDVEEAMSENEFKFSSQLVSHEELVRSPRDFLNTNVKIIGTVISVTGEDTGNGHLMEVLMGDPFEGDVEQLIRFEYFDTEYRLGFIRGDIVTIYGIFTSIEGNIPFIEARFVTFGT